MGWIGGAYPEIYMSTLFCRACGHNMGANGRFCGACGVQAAVELPMDIAELQQPRLGRMSAFFASQATLCLFTLLVFLGLVVALAPAGWRYANLQLRPGNSQQTATSGTRSMGTSNAPARCNQIVVIFNSTTSMARVSALLEQLDTTIAFGPNENGAFELSAPSTAAANVADALNRAADAVVSASLQRRCV